MEFDQVLALVEVGLVVVERLVVAAEFDQVLALVEVGLVVVAAEIVASCVEVEFLGR